MLEWLKTIIAGGVGGLIGGLTSGGCLLAGHWLQHHLQRKAKYEDLVLEKFTGACGELRRKTLELSAYIYHYQPHDLSEREKQTNEILRKVWEIDSLVIKGERFLGKEILECWALHYGKLIAINTGLASHASFSHRLWQHLGAEANLALDDLAKLMKERLKLPGLDFLTTEEWKSLHKKGLDEGNRIFENERERYEKRQGQRDPNV